MVVFFGDFLWRQRSIFYWIQRNRTQHTGLHYRHSMDGFGLETTTLATVYFDHNYMAITPRWNVIPPHFGFVWMAKIELKTNAISCDCSHWFIHRQATHRPEQSLRCAALQHTHQPAKFHAICKPV